MDKFKLLVFFAIFTFLPIYISVAVAQDTTTTIADPCAGVTCNSPPGECYLGTGTCSGGTCSYSPLASGTSCSSGTCDGAGVCAPLSCTGGMVDCGGYCADLTNDFSNCGTCGTVCSGAQTCQNSACVSTAGTTCGDGVCDSSETSSTCSVDCYGDGETCGNGWCGGSESPSSCPADCYNCGEGPIPSNGCWCGGSVNYGGYCCANVYQGSACGTSGSYCGDGACDTGESSTSCPSDCGGMGGGSCGDGTCNSGESMYSCSVDCGIPGDYPNCGDGTCSGGEDYWNCYLDCTPGSSPVYCGNNICESSSETPSSCPSDCGGVSGGYCGDASCNNGETITSCPGDCGGTGPVCTSSTPWNCQTSADCSSNGGNWCGNYCSEGSCPTCSSSQKGNCYDSSSCSGAGGNWCGNYCTDVACPTCSSSQLWNCFDSSSCTSSGGFWCNNYCQDYECQNTGTYACGEGPIPASGCECGGATYYSGDCCGNVYYPNGGSCSGGPGTPPPTYECSASNPWNCYDSASCSGAGGNWCDSSGTASGAGWCQNTQCPTCSSSEPWNCYDSGSCVSANGNWCGNYCTDTSCPTCTSDQKYNCYDSASCSGAGGNWCGGSGPADGSGWCSDYACPTCSSSEAWNCYDSSSCSSAGGNWCESGYGGGYCSSAKCPTSCGNGYCESSETATSCPSDCGSACPAVYDPVCGTDGVTYGNECQAKASGVNVDFYGDCSVCGNYICDKGEDSYSCPADCGQGCPFIPYPASAFCEGYWEPQHDDKGCVTGYECQSATCGDGICNGNEYPGNCHDDCGQFCPSFVADPVACDNGYYVDGGIGKDGCPRVDSCCGDNYCSYNENNENCPNDCGFERPFCGNGICDIGEDSFNCAGDCRDSCPTTIQCSDGTERSCKTTDFGCFCDTCPLDDDHLPPGCFQEVNNFAGTVNVVCEGGGSCPPLHNVEFMKTECSKQGGEFKLWDDPLGCQYPDCVFVDDSTNPFDTYDKCHTRDEIKSIERKCVNLGLPVQIDVRDECKVATCGRPSEQLCDRITPSEKQEIEQRCAQDGLHLVRDYDESGCEVLRCAEESFCPTDLPDEAYVRCQNVGGEMIVRKDGAGCIQFSECIRPGDDRDARVDPIDRIPETPELLGMAFKLEELKMKLGELADEADNVAAYYEQTGAPEAERWKRVADMFESAMQEVDEIKSELRDNLEDIDIENLLEVRHSVRYINDVLLKDIVYVMLSSSEEIETIGEGADCGTDEGCFDRAFRRCTPITFYPDGTRGPKVELLGVEDAGCKMFASMPAEFAPPGFGAVEMTCLIPNYAKGMRNPKTDIFPHCEGNMVELMKKYGPDNRGPGGPGGPPEGEGPPPGLIMGFLEDGQGPGGCVGRQCIDYCEENFFECIEYMDTWLATNGGPGGVRSMFEMGDFCEDRSNGDECFRWLVEERGVEPRDLGPGPDDRRDEHRDDFDRFEKDFREGPRDDFGPRGPGEPDDFGPPGIPSLPNVEESAISSTGRLVILSCNPGFYDCNGFQDDGCESAQVCSGG